MKKDVASHEAPPGGGSRCGIENLKYVAFLAMLKPITDRHISPE